METSVGNGTSEKLLPLKNLRVTLPPPRTSSRAAPEEEATGEEYEFAEVFGPNAAPPIPSDSASARGKSHVPEVIFARSHSFVGPSPQYSRSPPHFPLIDATVVEDGEEEEEEEEEEVKGKREEEKRVGPSDFEMLRVVGQGGFGKVLLVRKNGGDEEDREVLAMKVMKKEMIIRRNHVEYMIAERDILTRIDHPFIVKLRYSFQTKSKLYLILDFINGGHLFFQLYRQGLFSEDQARIYAAEIVSAVSHLHKDGIVHRDLKPENILMDADGHVILTDFGLAKEMDDSSKSNSMCGTIEYMAPEILLSKGHNKDADWWSVGILLFEMLTGQPPFTNSNRQKLQQRIIKEKVKLPAYLSSEAHSLLKGLLQKEPSRRLGTGPNGGDEIKSHKWFRKIDWIKLERRQLQPKFKPEVSGRECVANFDQCWTSKPVDDSPAPTPTSDGHFRGYSYAAPCSWTSK